MNLYKSAPADAIAAAIAAAITLACASCGGGGSAGSGKAVAAVAAPRITGVTQSAAIARFDRPWAVKALPDGRFLVTQRSDSGAMSVVSPGGKVIAVSGLPANIGMLDVLPAPDFAQSGMVYFSYMARDLTAPRVGRGKDDPAFFPERLMVARGRLNLTENTASLAAPTVIFQQEPAIVTVAGTGEPGGRLAFSPQHRFLFITSGDRQELVKEYLFRLDHTLGKIIRIFPDGTIPADNPFVTIPGARHEIWSLGHRNPYGLAFAPDGRLWSSEMGPMGGDELNLIQPERNYGWPAVSYGDNYDGTPRFHPTPGDGYEPARLTWTPVIAPTGMVFYQGREFADWRGDILLTGLVSTGLVRVRLQGDKAHEVQRIDLGTRIRDITEGAGGSLYILTDGPDGELRRITPRF